MGTRSEFDNDTLVVAGIKVGGDTLLANGADLNDFHMDVATRDFMTASSIYGYVPYKSEFVRLFVILTDAFTGTDTVFQAKDSDGNQMGSITVTASGSEAGQMYMIEGSGNLDFAAGDKVQFQSGGQGTGPVGGTITFVFKRVE